MNDVNSSLEVLPMTYFYDSFGLRSRTNKSTCFKNSENLYCIDLTLLNKSIFQV